MKIQDLSFLFILGALIILRKPRLAVLLGIIALLLSMPLFHLKIALFTAQRLVMYAASFFLFSSLVQLMSSIGQRPISPWLKLDHYKSP